MNPTAIRRTEPMPATEPISAPGAGGDRSGLRGLVERRPLLSFFVLSCLLSWWPAVLSGPSGGGLAGFGPFVAAIIVLALTRGRTGVVDCSLG